MAPSFLEPNKYGGALELQEVLATQGTRNSEIPPWLTYNKQLDEKLDPALEDAIKRYSEQRYVKTSTQNQEELCRQKELSYAHAAEYRWLDPSEYAEEGPRIGNILHSSEFINKLQKQCELHCWLRPHPQPKKITLVVQRFGLEPEVGCWVQEGFMPEYTIMGFDDHGVPLTERYRGWRTCLLQLILKDLITEKQANEFFGKAVGPVARKYNSLLFEFRNNYVKVV